jgi:hypothetical protein
MDPIPDLFLTTQVASVVHARLEATAPWGLKREANAAEGTAKDSEQPAISIKQASRRIPAQSPSFNEGQMRFSRLSGVIM